MAKDQRFIYLRDRVGNVPLLNLATGEVVTQKPGDVTPRTFVGECGLRRQILVQTDKYIYEEVRGEFAPLTKDIFEQMIPYHSNLNGWCFDWPHWRTETRGDIPKMRERLIAGLLDQARDLPYKFELLGAQRRWLTYFSDGNWKYQRRFQALARLPVENPYTKSGGRRKQYRDRIPFDAVRAYRDKFEGYEGPPFVPGSDESDNTRPMLYDGPAWAVRFLLDGQQAATGTLRVFVNDDGGFICTDWCQRSGRDNYSKGIDLQESEYTFATWVGGPLVQRTIGRSFNPVSTRTKIYQLAEMKQTLVEVPTFEQAFAKYESALARLVKKGLTDDEIVAKVTADLAAAEKTYAKVQELHEVPMTLDPAKHKPETCLAYQETTADATKSKSPFIMLNNYHPEAKPAVPNAPTYPAGAPSKVKPMFLLIDEVRVRAQLAKLRAFKASDANLADPTYKPVSQDEMAEAEAIFLKHMQGALAPCALAPEVKEAVGYVTTAPASEPTRQEQLQELADTITAVTGVVIPKDENGMLPEIEVIAEDAPQNTEKEPV